MEIDSATDPATPPHKTTSKHPLNGPTADSYVSTSEATEPTSSRAQVLEELRARIRELEGSPFKPTMGSEEEHYRCYMCKVGLFLYLPPSFAPLIHCPLCRRLATNAFRSLIVFVRLSPTGSLQITRHVNHLLARPL